MNDKGDCRTAPATPGLLINIFLNQYIDHNSLYKQAATKKVFENYLFVGFVSNLLALKRVSD